MQLYKLNWINLFCLSTVKRVLHYYIIMHVPKNHHYISLTDVIPAENSNKHFNRYSTCNVCAWGHYALQYPSFCNKSVALNVSSMLTCFLDIEYSWYTNVKSLQNTDILLYIHIDYNPTLTCLTIPLMSCFIGNLHFWFRGKISFISKWQTKKLH